MTNKLSEQVILEFQQGKEKAFELVFKLCYAPLLFFTTKIIESQDEAEDIVTEVFMALFKRCKLFNTEASIKAFLYVSARNRCLNFLKARRRHGIRSLDFASQIKDDTLLEYEYLIKLEILEDLHAGIEELPDACGRIFKLLYFDGLSIKEVAEQLNISPNTVSVQKMRAISMLRKKLGGKSLAIEWLIFAAAMFPPELLHTTLACHF